MAQQPVAGLDNRGVIGVALLVSLSILGCQSDAAGPTDTDAPTPVATTLTLSTSALSFSSLGATEQLTATVLDQNGATMSGASLVWASSASSVVSVTSSGLVTAVSVGTATITASSGAVSGTTAVTVQQVVAVVRVTPDPTALGPGETVQLVGAATDAGGSPVQEAAFTWQSSNVTVVEVDGNGNVQGVAAGTATITATTGNDASGTATVSVLTPELVSLRRLLADPVVVGAVDRVPTAELFRTAFSEILQGMAEGDLIVVRDALATAQTLAGVTAEGTDLVLLRALALVLDFGLRLVGPEEKTAAVSNVPEPKSS